MRLLLAGLVACLFCLLCARTYAQDKSSMEYNRSKNDLHIYLLIGQSNMAGRAPLTEKETGEIKRCYLLNDKAQWEPAKNPLNRFSTVRKKLSMQKMNPGYGFALTMLKEKPDLTLGLVVNAKGGTSIEQWAKGTESYSEAIKRVRIAQTSGTLKGILWHQGESNSSRSGSYLGKLETLVSNLRSDLKMPDLPFVAGQLFYNAETKAKTKSINEEIAKLPKTLPFTACVKSDGLTTMDNTHFGAKSMKQLGNRYAEEMLKLAIKQKGK